MSMARDLMPALFVGHGSPMNAIEDNPFRRSWERLGQELPKPVAILCVSAHWETRGAYVTTGEHPDTIHDFFGFPQALFDVEYPAPGAPDLAARVRRLASNAAVHDDEGRGIDHGAWSVLVAMYPEADVPVVQLSLDMTRAPAAHYELARELAPLRGEGVLVLGSGNIVHNLMLWHRRAGEPYDWALQFDTAIADRIRARRHHDIIDWQAAMPNAHLAVPTAEHFLPLLYPLALQREDEEAVVFNQSVQSSLSMTSVLVGS